MFGKCFRLKLKNISGLHGRLSWQNTKLAWDLPGSDSGQNIGKPPCPWGGGGISADVIWGKNTKIDNVRGKERKD
jgi:hypothetical protein